MAGISITAVLAAVQVALVLGLRVRLLLVDPLKSDVLHNALIFFLTQIPYRHGVSWPVKLCSISATVVITIGLLPPFWEIYKHRGRVVGLSELAASSYAFMQH